MAPVVPMGVPQVPSVDAGEAEAGNDAASYIVSMLQLEIYREYVMKMSSRTSVGGLVTAIASRNGLKTTY